MLYQKLKENPCYSYFTVPHNSKKSIFLLKFFKLRFAPPELNNTSIQLHEVEASYQGEKNFILLYKKKQTSLLYLIVYHYKNRSLICEILQGE